jgi:WD40 repeat protein
MHLARGLDDGRVRVWSIAAAQDIVDLAATCGSVRSIAWSAAPAASGAMTLGCLADDSTLRIWRIEGATALPVGPVAEWVRAFAWAPDGARILTGTDDGRLQILDLRSAGGAKEIGHRPEHGVRAVAWSPAGDRLASGHDDGAVWLWDPERSDEPIEVGRHADQVRELTWSPDGSQLLSIGADRVLRGWAAVPVDGVGDCALALDGELSALACNPAGDRIAVAGSSPGPHVLEVVVS